MVCVPGASVASVSDAWPLLSTVPLPKAVIPSVNWTEPVGAGPLVLVTVAVNVTGVPTLTVELLEAIVVTVVI